MSETPLSIFKDYLKILKQKRRYQGVAIETYRISNDVELGKNSYIGRHSTLRPGVSIGEKSIIEDYVFLGDNAKIGRNVRLFKNVTVDPNVSIGDYSYVTINGYLFSGKVGNFCSIGPYCQIGLPEHPINHISTSPATYGPGNIFNVPTSWNDFNEPPCVGSDVWIGSNVVILQDVKVGHGAIIAAGSVVNKDVPPYAIVGGVPAKIIRMRFDEQQINYLLNLKWWDLPTEELMKYQKLFAKKEKWIDHI